MKKSTSAFTIIELIVAVTVIAILAGVTIVAYKGVQGRSRDATRSSDIANITKALEQYYSDNGAYPIASGSSGSVINGWWYTSGDASWSTFQNTLTSAGVIDNVPKDPNNITNSNPLNANSYAYAYFSGSYCGRSAGQWYLLVYRFESRENVKFSDGNCTTNPLGDNYFSSGASYYRSVK